MYKLLYKGIKFDDFQLYREANNSGGCEYGYSTDENLNKKDWEEADVYICPHCIKKYNLYTEAETNIEEVEKYISGEYNDGRDSMVCGIKGCYNKNSYDCCLDLAESTLENYTKEELKEHYISNTIPYLKNMCVTLKRITEELDYRDRVGMDSDENKCGWDDDLYQFSTKELEDIETIWSELKEENNEYRVMVIKYGYSVINAQTEVEALEKTKTMTDSDFDWSDFDEAQIVEKINY